MPVKLSPRQRGKFRSTALRKSFSKPAKYRASGRRDGKVRWLVIDDVRVVGDFNHFANDPPLITYARTNAEAIRILKRRSFEIILLDYGTGMGGTFQATVDKLCERAVAGKPVQCLEIRVHSEHRKAGAIVNQLQAAGYDAFRAPFPC